MRLTQGTFSFLPDLSDAQIVRQLDHCLSRGWAIGIETTDDPHPRNTYWEMFGNPMFDIGDAAGVMLELQRCREAFPNQYIRLTAFDSSHGTESVVLSFIVNRPAVEPGFRLVRTEEPGRTVRYAIESYSVQRAPEGQRY
ncbi:MULTISPECIES: ribulose bisphosphate carboxylase small subunit [Roseateles]|uniref:Ribulose bisphosphate carboxylase small subunit n=1 Tax=Pelomonas caseinilytica TaxID=2906763 RepID=A0ABS8XBC5_9BURK|nr:MULTISPECIES: ribulose bisphosphate carboxylase small subunit [unclassified Roseateles]MCE4536993.1 ribulose bisphosphate carboxylase small subunit [Pelomonas sp. P7]HEV6968815.1 ribulose bisphosphate carboxylase small subunit [Roseateles sp.]